MTTTPITITTIGFTKKSASEFFGKLRQVGAKRIIDVRLNNTSQLSAFAKKDDLQFFLKEILSADYVHLPLLAPSPELFKAYKTDKGPWPEYQRQFLQLMEERHIEDQIDPKLLDGACLLCSEDKSHQCHRSVIVDYLQGKWGNLIIKHV